MALASEIIHTSDSPSQYTVIWLHGLGADGHDFIPIIPELRLPSTLAVKFIFPHAPIRPVTLNNGYEMRAWFDLFSLDRVDNAKLDDILTTVQWINTIIDEEINKGTAAENILLAGFSQGGVIALFAGLLYPPKLAGIMALSTYLPFSDYLLDNSHSQQAGLSIFAAHGKSDPVIPLASWQSYVPQLEAKGFDVEAHDYPMEHAVSPTEIADISRWLQKTLKT